ncbi:MAG: phytase [Chloroflexota bacterium]|nr:phytase [Chloroflexota bacterium]
MKRTRAFVALVLSAFVVSTVTAQQPPIGDRAPIASLVETAPSHNDGATAPAIWLHPVDLAQSLILGADDNAGLAVYDLDGTELAFIDTYGGVAGVDVRYNFALDDERIPLIAANVADAPQFVLYTVDVPTRTLREIGIYDTGIPTGSLCMYRSPLTDALYVFVFSGNGQVEQYRLDTDGGDIVPTLLRAFDVGGELEACTVDDALRRLYLSEGDIGVWRYNAEPEGGISRAIVDLVGGAITEEIEGLAVYAGAGTDGYLLVSNEKAHSILLYERAGNNALVGEFMLSESDTIDAVTEPTGLAVATLPINDQFPAGIFIASDDVNSNPNGDNNFKLASWADIAAALNVVADTSVDPRAVIDTGAVAFAEGVAIVTAAAETVPVPSGTDAADDPAIWIHPTDPLLSTIIGTDKTAGLVVYNLDGSLLQVENIGRVNNVDLREGFMLGGAPVALVTTTNRTFNSLAIYAVNPETREIENVAARDIISDMNEVYGICMYLSPVSGELYAFVNSADTGEVEQYRLFDAGAGMVDAEIVREFVVGSQTEGCVVDDENETLYIGEEGVGLWRYGAEPDAPDILVQVDSVDGNLTADVEGVTLYTTADGGGYLIASSQGSSTFVVYARGGQNEYIGTFAILEGDATDAVSGTDGIDVTNVALGDLYPEGVFIAQDDLNITPNENQNFKLVSWADIAAALGLE